MYCKYLSLYIVEYCIVCYMLKIPCFLTEVPYNDLINGMILISVLSEGSWLLLRTFSLDDHFHFDYG